MNILCLTVRPKHKVDIFGNKNIAQKMHIKYYYYYFHNIKEVNGLKEGDVLSGQKCCI